MSDTMLEKVRKLLAKAEDPGCTPEEAAALNDKAAELIAKYGVDQALLAQAGHTTDEVGVRTITIPAPYALDKAVLLSCIAQPLRGRTVRIKEWKNGGYVYTMRVFGFQSDLERIDLLYTSLLIQMATGMAASTPRAYETTAAYRRTWMAGFTSAVNARLKAAEDRAAQESTPAAGTSTALVLVDRSKQVDQQVALAYPRLKSAPPRTLRGSGAAEGYSAGQRADLGGTRIGRGRRPALAG